MKLTINIYYTGAEGKARAFAEEMHKLGIVDKVRAEKGNLRYEYFFSENDPDTVVLIDCWENEEALAQHHASTMMKEIADLREKYHLKMRVEQYISKEDETLVFENIIQRRTATRKFKDEKVAEAKIKRILEAGRLAPTAKNMQPQKIYVAQSKEALAKIDKVSPWRYNAPVVLIVGSDKNIAWHKDAYSTYEMDACIVATHMMLAATNLGIDNIWVEMFDKEALRKVFAMPSGVEPICLIPLGYKADDYAGNPQHLMRKDLDSTVIYV